MSSPFSGLSLQSLFLSALAAQPPFHSLSQFHSVSWKCRERKSEVHYALPCLGVILDRDLLVVLDRHVVVHAHGLDGLDKGSRDFGCEAHEEVVLVRDHTAL